MLEISSQDFPRCVLVKAEGRIDSGSTPDLKKVLDSITGGGKYKIVLNLAKVSFMSSAGLRQLLDTQKTCKHLKRGDLVLAELPQNLKDVLDLAGLDPIFKVYDSEVEAVANF